MQSKTVELDSKINSFGENLEPVETYEGSMTLRILNQLREKPVTIEKILSSMSKDVQKYANRIIRKLEISDVIERTGKEQEYIQFKNRKILELLKISDSAEVPNSQYALRDFFYTPFPDNNTHFEDLRTPLLDQVKAEVSPVSYLRLTQNEEIVYEAQKNRNKAVLLFTPLDANSEIPENKTIEKVSEELQEQLVEMSFREGYLKVSERKKLSEDEMKSRLGLGHFEETIGGKVNIAQLGRFGMCIERGYVPSLAVYTPSINSFEELENTLFERLKLLRDIADTNGIYFSSIPVFKGNQIAYPYFVFCQKLFNEDEIRKDIYNSAWFSDYRAALFALLQSTRNSINPNQSRLCEDYSRFCYFFDFMKSSSFNTPAYEQFENDYNQISTLQSDLGMLKFIVSEQDHGTATNLRISLPSSFQEIMTMIALEQSLNSLAADKARELFAMPGSSLPYGVDDEWWEKDNEAYFRGAENLVLNYLRHSFVMNKDPLLVFPVKDELGKIPYDSLWYLSHNSSNKGYVQVVEKMVADGLLKSVPVSQYWPVFMNKIRRYLDEEKVPQTYRDILEKDFATKNGTNTLRILSHSLTYEEMTHKSWENIFNGGRWIL